MLGKVNWYHDSFARSEIRRLQHEWADRARDARKTLIDHEEYRAWRKKNPCPYTGQKGAYDLYHRWSIFTMYWPTISFAALVGRE